MIENRHRTTDEAEEQVERQAREFELLKPYLVQRWEESTRATNGSGDGSADGTAHEPASAAAAAPRS